MSNDAGGDRGFFPSCASHPFSSPPVLHSRFFYVLGLEGIEIPSESEVLHYCFLEAMSE